MKPLVSIVIPAYNAEKWIGYAVQSALAQTWPRKEIIVINDGSTDRTAEVVRQFASRGMQVVSTENRGLSAAINQGLRICQGDYIQELDADDLLAPDKIERQLAALREGDSKRLLLSSPWAPFYYRTRKARFIHTSLCQDLSPVEWLLRKLSENLHMQNATWLVSRELIEAAGPWKEDLYYDQDGEYFTRVLMASEGTRFVPETGIFYRVSGAGSISHIGTSKKKKESLLRSMKLHIQYIRSLEESERVRKACLAYLQTWYHLFFDSDLADFVAELQSMATELGGSLKSPGISWKYAWLAAVIGIPSARNLQDSVSQAKVGVIRRLDKVMFDLERRQAVKGNDSGVNSPPRKEEDLIANRES